MGGEVVFLLVSGLWGWGALPSDHWSILEALRVPSALPCLSLSKRLEWWVLDTHAQEISALLHGWGWPVGAGAAELDLRLGGAAWQPVSFGSCHPLTYHLQTGQISLCGATCY